MVANGELLSHNNDLGGMMDKSCGWIQLEISMLFLYHAVDVAILMMEEPGKGIFFVLHYEA